LDNHEIWRDCFGNWPAEVPRRGVLVTQFNEQIAFDGFMTGQDMLLMERRAPDTVGARKVALPYRDIAALKYIDVIKGKSFEAAGFKGTLPQG
jgi:hypothetical protein